MAGVWRELIDLVLPADCPGCGAAAALCRSCATTVAGLTPAPSRPTPAPARLPPCVAAAEYAGPVRRLLVGYKEHGHHRLAAPLADVLARGVRAAVPAGRPVALVPVPGTAAAARARHGDHMLRLARRAARRLRRTGTPVAVYRPVAALPRADSAGLDAAARAAAARHAFRVRGGRLGRLRAAVANGAEVVLLDDVLTTGATLAALADRLLSVDIPVRAGVVIAATRRRYGGPATTTSATSRGNAGRGVTRSGNPG